MSCILVVEDEPIIQESLKRLLQRQGYSVTAVGSVAEAEEKAINTYDLIISDLRLPGEAGTSLISRATPIPVLIMTSYSTVQSAVDALKQGAVDYISKPFNHDDMILTVKRILEKSFVEQQNTHLRQELARNYPVNGMIGECPAMLDVFDKIHRVAGTNASVLILGETGTGKELVARAIHSQSTRSQYPLISVNCAAFAENLIGSELFGQEKGAFSGAMQSNKGLIESANGGTLFLDEVADLPLEAQASLLQVLQDNKVQRFGSSKTISIDVRILVATYRNLRRMVEDRLFREDLYYRLNVVEITLPPLRDRDSDIRQLADSILTKMRHRTHRRTMTFSDAAYRQMLAYDWPGNVRELENIIERAIILCHDYCIDSNDLGLDIKQVESAKAPYELENKLSLDEYLISFVKQYQAQYNETELAKMLGISRKSLWERRQRLEIPGRR